MELNLEHPDGIPYKGSLNHGGLPELIPIILLFNPHLELLGAGRLES
jgi:hypothetical protein